MPDTAADVITDALKEIVVQSSESSILPYDAQAGIFYLNAMMASFAAMGINLGYTSVTSLSDLVTVDDGALDGIVKNLAIELHPVFKESVKSNDLFSQAQEALEALRQIAFPGIGPQPYPENLPLGSGNYESGFIEFYDTLRDPLNTELYGIIGVEDAS